MDVHRQPVTPYWGRSFNQRLSGFWDSLGRFLPRQELLLECSVGDSATGPLTQKAEGQTWRKDRDENLIGFLMPTWLQKWSAREKILEFPLVWQSVRIPPHPLGSSASRGGLMAYRALVAARQTGEDSGGTIAPSNPAGAVGR